VSWFADARRRGFARFYDRVVAKHDALVAERRAALLGTLEGTVLELGPGTGINFRHLPRSVRWIGVEPNPHMHPFLLQRAQEAGVHAEIRGIAAEEMEVEPESVDAVVCTLVLCSVDDPARILADARRVLKPGGRFVFLEHVGAPPGSALRLVQRLIRPGWRFLADGCCPDRDTAEMLRCAGFSALELEEFRLPRSMLPITPHVAGTAIR